MISTTSSAPARNALRKKPLGEPEHATTTGRPGYAISGAAHELQRLVRVVAADDEQCLGVLAAWPAHRRVADRRDGDPRIVDDALDEVAVDVAVDRDKRAYGGIGHGVFFGRDLASGPATV